MHALGFDFTDGDEFFGLNHNIVGGSGHQRVEVVGGAQEDHVTELVNDVGTQESNVGTNN